MVEEPLPAASPLWAMEHVLITPHTAGETCRYEDNVLAIIDPESRGSGAARPSCSTRWFRPSSLRATLSFILEGG